MFAYFSRGNTSSAKNMNATVATKTTVRKSPFATVTPLLTPTQEALFSDTFADNSNNWDVINGAGYSISISNNVLNLTEANRDTLREPLPTSTSFNDFSITTTFTTTQGDLNDSVGLFVRASGDKPQGYYVEMYGDGSYAIGKTVPDPANGTKAKYIYLVKPVKTALLQPDGQPNVITVIMKGALIVLLINKIVVTSIVDTTYTSGSIYVFARNGNTSNGVHVAFDSIVVYPAPEQLPN